MQASKVVKPPKWPKPGFVRCSRHLVIIYFVGVGSPASSQKQVLSWRIWPLGGVAKGCYIISMLGYTLRWLLMHIYRWYMQYIYVRIMWCIPILDNITMWVWCEEVAKPSQDAKRFWSILDVVVESDPARVVVYNCWKFSCWACFPAGKNGNFIHKFHL